MFSQKRVLVAKYLWYHA